MKKALIVAAVVIAVIGVGFIAGKNYASRKVEDVVLTALGPDSEMQEVRVRLTDVELSGIRVPAPKGWPAETALRAKRVVLKPKLSHVFSDRMELTDVVIEDAYISAARPASGGGLKVMPGLAKKTEKGESGKRGADIRTVHLKNCTIDVYDATVGGKGQRVRMENVNGTLEDVQVPGLGARTELNLTGALPGPTHRGEVSVRGWVEASTKSSELTTRVRGADLAVFEPYLVQKTKAGIDSGTFDLEIKATVRNNVLSAPGTLTVHSLELQKAENPLEALAQIPRRAALGAVADKEENITVKFTLEGNLDDPKFSLAGEGALVTGFALIKVFGLSFEGLVRAFYLIINGFGASLGAALA